MSDKPESKPRGSQELDERLKNKNPQVRAESARETANLGAFV
jgi:hypothetical protein